MRMLSIRISSWPVCSGYASVPGAYAQHFLKGMRSVHALVPDAYAQCTHQFLTRMLSVRISSWLACSACASVPDAHAQCTHQFITRMLRVYKMNIWKIWILMRMLSMRVRNWCICSGCASVPDPYAQHAQKGRSMRVRNSIFLIIFKVPKTSKNFKNLCWRLQMVSKASGKKIFLPKLKKKILLKIWLSIRVRNFAAPNEPLKIKKHFYFKGTQDWEFFWLRFWILYCFITSYA